MNQARRDFLTQCVAAPPSMLAASCVNAQDSTAKSSEAKTGMGRLGIVIHSNGIRRAHRPSGFGDPLVFLEYCRKLGAAGVQVSLGRGDDAFVGKIREAVVASGMYLEGIVGLPRGAGDVARFNDELRTAKECGAAVL